MKIVGMIPARMGSQRVKKKNVRLINGRPLIDYALESVYKSDIFDEVYINSEDEIFTDLAKNYGFNFYKRPEEFSSNTSTNDEFAQDFLLNIECDVLIQILPTSPFLTETDIKEFTNFMLEGDLDALISVENKQIASVFEGKPVNFEISKPNPPSQTMVPVQAYATALMGWKKKKFLKNMQELGSAYHGGSGKTGYFELKGLSTIDIDNESDFQLAETIMLSIANKKDQKPKYYEGGKVHSEVDVPSILKRDGVANNDLFDVNNEKVSIYSILKDQPKDQSWSKRVVDSDSNSMTIICQLPGEGNRRHYHPDWNEWWYIYEGEWEWEIEGEKKIVKEGDIVFMEKNRVHKITASGSKRAIRFAVSRSDVAHVFI
tara:strand:- start:2996 stop:4117 length:1122 start_codon:yes stop_codon:yes gene_type:complete